jgi:uncharacterized protein
MIAESIKAQLQQSLQPIPGLCFAMLYGSAVDSEHFRDLDVGLWVDREIVSKAQELAFGFDLAAKLEKVLSFPVDVRVINNAPLAFRYNVSKGIPLLINDEDRFTHFLERTWDEYLDFAPVAMQYLQELASDNPGSG